MSSKVSSFEEKVKLPPTETISRCYQPQGNRNRIIRILTVAVYVLCVSLAAIMLSLYYIFIWDPTIRPFVTKGNNCEKIVIPEKIAIRLLNSSEVTAEQFYRLILEQYRILNQLQIQRQQFLQQQQLQLKQLAASNRFQEIFATATIIQANKNDRALKPVTPTNGTFLFDPRVKFEITQPPPPPPQPPLTPPTPPSLPPLTPSLISDNIQTSQQEQQTSLTEHLPIILDTIPVQTTKRKSHRKHTNHHRHNSRKGHKKATQTQHQQHQQQQQQPNSVSHHHFRETPLNPPSPAIIAQDVFTSMPIPLILNSNEDDRQTQTQTQYSRNNNRISTINVKSILNPGLTSYQSYLNPILNGELIFEK